MGIIRRLAISAAVLLWSTAVFAQQEEPKPPPTDADKTETKTEPPKTEPPKTEPPKTEPPKTEPPKTEPKVEKKVEPPKTTPKAEPEEDPFDDDEEEEEDDDWDDEDPEPTYPRLEHRGYFRFRADMFSNLHLGTTARVNGKTIGTSGFLPPLTENGINNGNAIYDPDVVGSENDEAFLASANMRLRYQPSFLVSPSLKFAATFDVMDNLVLGSTPDFAVDRPDAPLAAFSTAQAPPGDSYQFQESIRVKELYGEWKLLGAPLRFGRMKSHWGLGILANGGEDWDDDFGDYVDRVMIALQFYGIYFAGGYDIVSSGPLHNQAVQPFGQAYDLTETDDVQQGFIAIFSKPLQPDELKTRRERLNKLRKPAFDWGVYAVYRKQTLDVSTSSLKGLADGTIGFDETELVKREAWAVVPDLWLRFEYRPTYTQALRLELEFTMIIGEIGEPVDDPKGKSREIMSWGLAFEGDYTIGGLTIGLDAGVASGDSAEYLAVLDNKNFASGGDTSAQSNTKIENFRFDRNYHVDMILFREIIGAVTNAWYVKPYVRYDLFDSPDGAIGGRLDILVAGAMEKKAYPGDEMFLGAEFDAKIFVEDTGKFYADLAFGLLIPGGAFNLKEGFNGYQGDTKKAELAWTLQTHIVIKY